MAVTERRPRVRRHRIMAGVLAGYATAALAVLVGHARVAMPAWLALHLLTLGVLTNAVLVWSRHFAQALLHARVDSERWAAARLVSLNAGVLAVLAGVSLGQPVVVALGVAGVVIPVAAHGWALGLMARRATLAGRLRVSAWYYVASAGFLVVGGVVGGLLGTGAVPAGSRWDEPLHLAHVHLNLFGFVGLAVVGTTFMLWPAVLRTRMGQDVPAVAGRVLPLLSGGLSVAVVGLLARQPVVAAAGMLGYAAGLGWALVPWLATARRRAPHTAAAWHLASGTGWLLAGTLLDTVGVARGQTAAVAALGPLVPVLAVGFAGLTLIGALTFLLPVTIGGGPAGNKALARILELGWPARLAAANIGVLLVALPPPGLRIAGWLLAALGAGGFVPLLAAATVRASARVVR